MARTETYQSLLDKAETPLQTHILLAQLAILRKSDKERRSGERGSALPMAIFTVVVLVAWLSAMVVLAGHLSAILALATR